MKMILLEPDLDLANNIKNYLNSTRIKFDIKIINNEEEFFDDTAYILECSIFILNLKDPRDISIKNFIRETGNDSPILLILEKDVSPCLFKTLYYLSYSGVIVKDFIPEEITFQIYKLCDLWLDEVFFITNDIYFNYKLSRFYYHDELIHLGKKEALLLKLLFIKSPCIATFDEINYYVYINEFVSQERIRSIVRELRKKIPVENLIKTVKGEGYCIPKLIKCSQ